MNEIRINLREWIIEWINEWTKVYIKWINDMKKKI